MELSREQCSGISIFWAAYTFRLHGVRSASVGEKGSKKHWRRSDTGGRVFIGSLDP